MFPPKNEYSPNNPEESSTTEINKHAPSGYSLFTDYSLFIIC